MRRLFSAAVMVVVMLFTLCSLAYAGTFGGGSAGGGARASSPSSSSSAGRSSSSSGSSASRPSSGSSGSSARPSSGSGGVRPSTPSQPSSGRIAQPAPAARLVPRAMPPNARTPVGRNFYRDRAALTRNPRYLDPYNSAYYGNPSSPFFYMYLAELQNSNQFGDGARPVPYQGQQCKPKKKGVPGWAVVLIAVGCLLVGGGVGYFMGRDI